MVTYGIDLGTSFSKLARYDGEKCEALNVSGGIMSLMGDAKNLITAVFLQENGEFAVGQAAYNIRTLAPENYVCEFKRRLGTDTPYILGGKAYSTEDLYTQIFRRMRTIAAEAGEEIGHVVLTYPATYTQAKIDRLRRAANTAGLWSVEALDEPAAAAAFYAAENYLAAGERVLVYDFGGGTFDVSLVEKIKDGFRHLCASKGLADCGGADFDRLIFEDIKEKLLASPDVDGKRAFEKPAILLHLTETAVKIKHQLSQAESYTEQISVGFDEFRYTLTRGGFERMIAPYVARTLLKCKEAIAEAGLKERDITRVLPVGGTCSIPYIRRRLEESFPAAAVARVPNPGLMVCQGAARAAERKPEPNPEPKPAPVTGVATEILSGKKNVRFGEYYWRVLDVQGGRALLLTEDIIEERRYHSSSTAITWKRCALREYLNGGFLRKFGSQDQARILQVNLSNPNNQWYGTVGGGSTTDKIFLLSIEEAVKYFGDSGQQKSRPTDAWEIDEKFNSSRIAKYGSWAWWWWLRSPGGSSDLAPYVYDDGSLCTGGFDVYRVGGGVRPALWLNLESEITLAPTPAPAPEPAPKPALLPPNPAPKPEPKPEPVTGVAAEILSGKKNVRFGEFNWRVLDIQGGRALLLTEDIIEKRRYHSSDTAITWERCALREYLNGGFLRKFGSQDQAQILQVNISNPNNQWYGTAGGGGTTDRIFLLSIEEAVKYFGDSGQLNNRPNEITWCIDDGFNNNRIAKYGNMAWRWWLRSPGRFANSAAAYVYDDGRISTCGFNVYCVVGGVRPALWLNLESEIFSSVSPQAAPEFF